MIKVMEKNKKKMYLLLVTVWFWLLSFYMERFVFVVDMRNEHMFTYVNVKIWLFLTLYLLINFFYNMCSDDKKTVNIEWRIVTYALPYWLLNLFYFARAGVYPFVGDEFNINSQALQYENLHGAFTYITTYFHMIAMMIFPDEMFVVIFKIFIAGLIVGYCIWRIKRIWNSKVVFLLYFLFAFSPSIDLGISVHRLPMYGMLYLFFICKLICDYKENVKIDKGTGGLLIVIVAILTQWRVEGIYFLILGPILLCLAYRIKDKKRILLVSVTILVAQVAIYYPQAQETVLQKSNYSEHRLVHFYNYVITNMLRNGLDRFENADELKYVDDYLSIEVIDRLNNDYGNIAYEDEFIAWLDGYVGVRADASEQDLLEYEDAVKRIILKNPVVYAKSQFGAWNYITMKNYPHSFRQVIVFVTGNLYVPLIVLLITFCICLHRKKWLVWFITSGVLCNVAITTILLPAAYYKYYYVMYLYAGFLVVVAMCSIRCKKQAISILNNKVVNEK